jgi:hypothetical protein
MTKKTQVGSLLFIAAALALAACGGHKEVKQAGIPTAPASNAPAWVNQGSGAFKDGSFYGVGLASGIRNRALAVDTADGRARAKVAEVFNTYVAKLNKDYMASTTAGDMKSSSEEQNVTQTLKTFTQMTLTGAAPIDHWMDPATGDMYSLVKLDMTSVKQTLDQAKELNAQVRDYVKANADKAFNDLAAEEAKH